jgi:hypothetical protein
MHIMNVDARAGMYRQPVHAWHRLSGYGGGAGASDFEASSDRRCLYGSVDQSFHRPSRVRCVSFSVFVWPPGVGHQTSG